MDAKFTVTQVVGGKINGNLEPAEEFRSRVLNRIGREICLADIAPRFEADGGPKIRDMTDYFQVGDQFQVILVAEHIVDYRINVKALRERKSLKIIERNRHTVPSFGYIVQKLPQGFVIWAKINGGSLIFAEIGTVCDGNIPEMDDMDPVGVAVMLKKKAIPSEGDFFEVIHYESNSTNFILDRNTMKSYFPVFRRFGKIRCILEGRGAVFSIVTTTECGDDHQGPANPNRPVPIGSDRIFCPTWGFPDGNEPWTSHCRMETEYGMRIVFIHNSNMAYGCHWIALSARNIRLGDYHSGRGPTPGQREEAHRLVKEHDTYMKKLAKMSNWDSFNAYDRFAAQLIKLDQEAPSTDGNAAAASTGQMDDFEANCRIFHEMILKLRLKLRAKESAAVREQRESATTSTGRRGTSIGSQTVQDSKFFDDMRGFLKELPMAMHPDKLEEFWIRFKPLEMFLKK